MPEKVPEEKCEKKYGIQIYKADELARRKLNTIIGEKPRMKPRDIYDAGWLAAERPELINEKDRRELKAWLAGMNPGEKTAHKIGMEREEIIGRVNIDEVWKQLEAGIQSLNTEPEKAEPRKEPHVERPEAGGLR